MASAKQLAARAAFAAMARAKAKGNTKTPPRKKKRARGSSKSKPSGRGLWKIPLGHSRPPGPSGAWNGPQNQASLPIPSRGSSIDSMTNDWNLEDQLP